MSRRSCKSSYTGPGLALGVGLGVAFGAAFDAIAIGVALGTSIGLVLGAACGRMKSTTPNEPVEPYGSDADNGDLPVN